MEEKSYNSKTTEVYDNGFQADRCFLIWMFSLVFIAFVMNAPVYLGPVLFAFIFFAMRLFKRVGAEHAGAKQLVVSIVSDPNNVTRVKSSNGFDFSERSSLRQSIIRVPNNFDQLYAISPLFCKARLTHELIHCRYKDFITTRAYVVVSFLGVGLIASWIWYLFWKTGDVHPFVAHARSNLTWLALISGLVVIPAVLSITRLLFFLRRREFRADREAFTKIGRDYLAYLSHQLAKERISRTLNPASRLLNALTHPSFHSRLKALSEPRLGVWEIFYDGLFIGFVLQLSSYVIFLLPFGLLVLAFAVSPLEIFPLLKGLAACISAFIALHFTFGAMRLIYTTLLTAKLRLKEGVIFLAGMSPFPAFLITGASYGANGLSTQPYESSLVIFWLVPPYIFATWTVMIFFWHLVVRNFRTPLITTTTFFYWSSLAIVTLVGVIMLVPLVKSQAAKALLSVSTNALLPVFVASTLVIGLGLLFDLFAISSRKPLLGKN